MVVQGNGPGNTAQLDVTIGTTGPEGPQGPVGAQGATGPQGPQGPAGLSAYERVPRVLEIPANFLGFHSVGCPAGKNVLGGGMNVTPRPLPGLARGG